MSKFKKLIKKVDPLGAKLFLKDKGKDKPPPAAGAITPKEKEKPKRGRRASQLTGVKGVSGDLGSVSRPQAGTATEKLGG